MSNDAISELHLESAVDITYNVYEDANGLDPDSYSKKLNDYHRILWSKQLPNGNDFYLESVGRKRFLLSYDDGKNSLLVSSDCIAHTYSYWKNMQHIIQHISKDEYDAFYGLATTIGGYIIFPAKRINGNPTINAIRGMHGWIRDRFDLTLECIRRWYVGEDNPLFKDLDRYKSYFELFVNFKGYIDFFLLNDLIDIDYKVKFWLPFLDFGITQPLPRDIKEYREYMINVKVFVEKRNQRIKAWSLGETI